MPTLAWQTPLSVGRVLNHSGEYGDFSFVPAAALTRGVVVHEVTALRDGGMGPTTIDPAYQGYLDAYDTFSRQLTPSWSHIEHAFDNLTAQFHGVVDRVGSMRGHDRVVLEIKTSKPGNRRDSVQTAAYACGLYPHAFQDCTRYGLYLADDGSYTLKTFSDLNDFLVWRSHLEHALEDTHGTPRTRIR